MNKLKNIIFIIPLMFAFNAIAQSSMLEEVVVTAQKKEETLQDAPIAITALTASTIEDLDIANVVDLAGMAPNVHIINTPSNNTAATIAIRGGSTTNPAITWEPTVGMYLDGVYLGKGQGSIFDVVDLVMEWSNLESEEQCKYFIQTKLNVLEISLGDFIKALLKINP